MVFTTVYKNDSKLVIVSINEGLSAIKQKYILKNCSFNSFISYTTSSIKNCEKGDVIPALNGSFYATLDSLSITTFVLD